MATLPLSDLPEPPVLEIDPFSDENIEHPYAFHTTLRETAPLVWIEKYQMYATGSYKVVKACMGDAERFPSSGGIGLSDIRKPGALRPASPISEVDPPKHTKVRHTMNNVLSPLIVRQMKEIFNREAQIFVDRAIEKGLVDGMADLVVPFILKVFPDAMGIDINRQHFLSIGEMNFNQLGPKNELLRRSEEAVAPFMQEFTNAFQRKAALPGGFAERTFEAEDRGELEPGEASLQVRGFIRGGVDTTIGGIGHTLKLLAENPDQWAKVVANPAKAKGAFEEGIRLASPARVIFRTAAADTELGGYRIKQDVKIGMFLGAANRDPAQFPDPDRYDIDRDTAGVHVALGTGHHICIGQNIARSEAEAILSALAARIDRIEIAGTPKDKLVNTLRTLETLPLRLIAKQ